MNKKRDSCLVMAITIIMAVIMGSCLFIFLLGNTLQLSVGNPDQDHPMENLTFCNQALSLEV